jgi:hypothetical protein
MILCEWVNGMPQKDTVDRAAYNCMLISYRRLSPQFQFSLSGVTLVYLSQWYYSTVQYKHSHHFRLADDTLTGPDNDKHYQLFTVYTFS